MGATRAVIAARARRQRALKVNTRMNARGIVVEPHTGLELRAGRGIKAVGKRAKEHFRAGLSDPFIRRLADGINSKQGFRALSRQARITVGGEFFRQLSEGFSGTCAEASRKLPNGTAFTVAVEPVSVSSRKARASDVYGNIKITPNTKWIKEGWRPMIFKSLDPAITTAERKIYEEMAGKRKAKQIAENARIPSVRAFRAQKPRPAQIADRVVTTGYRARVLVRDPKTRILRALTKTEQKKHGLEDTEKKQAFIISKSGEFLALLIEGKAAKRKTVHRP